MSGFNEPPTPNTQGDKNIWNELDTNPGPLAPQATTLTTRPGRVIMVWPLTSEIMSAKLQR